MTKLNNNYNKVMEILISLMKGTKKLGAGGYITQPVAAAILDSQGDLITIGTKYIVARGGVIHAEQRVIEESGGYAKGSTLISTLEPCVQRKSGKSCSELIVESGIEKVVVGALDPNQAMRGVIYLLENNIDVIQLKKYSPKIERFIFSIIKARYEKKENEEYKKEEIQKIQDMKKELRKRGKLGYKRPKEKEEARKRIRNFGFNPIHKI